MTQGKPATINGKPHRLKTGAEYKDSLKDNRQIWVGGRKLASVYDEPALAKGIDTLAGMFDDQFDPEFRDATTIMTRRSARSSAAPGRCRARRKTSRHGAG